METDTPGTSMLIRSLGKLRNFRNRSISNVAVLLECKDSKLNPSALNLFSAAQNLSSEFSLIISTADENVKIEVFVKENRNLLSLKNVKKIFMNCGDGTAEQIAGAVETTKFDHLITNHDTFGKNCLPRIAGKISESVLITDVQSIKKLENENVIEFERSIYAGNATAKVHSIRPNLPHFITIRSTAFKPIDIPEQESELPEIEIIKPSSLNSKTKVIKREINKTGSRPDLGGSAKIVISGGRALKSAENFEKLIYPLADVLGAAVGASRAAVDAGYVSNDLQIGQTGKIVAPQLYIAIGISGAIQHVAGMKDSKIIVSINKDPECPIFQISDYSLVGDLFTIIPELTAKLSK